MSKHGQDPDRRPTKAERKEAARLERDQLQRGMKTKRRNRAIGIVLVAIAVAVIAALVVVLRPEGTASAQPSPEDLLAAAPDAVAAAGCEPVRTVDPYAPQDADAVHVGGDDARFPAMPSLQTYPSTPPTSGPHNQVQLAAGIYDTPPPIDQALHSLEHGGVIIWYSPTASPEAIEELTSFYGRRLSDASVGQDRLIIAPYDYPDQGAAGQLPAGVQMSTVAWHRLQECATPSLAVAYDFSSQYGFPTADGREYIGEAPEPGAAM